MRRPGLLSIAVLLLCVSAWAQDPFEFWPGARYDTAIPTMEEVLGAGAGDIIVSHDEMYDYFMALGDAAPDRMKIFDFGRTWEGRKLVYAAIGSAENIARLDDLRDRIEAMADPERGSEEDRARWARDLPATVWLSYSVHGNEISGTNAGLLTAYYLLASQRDPMVEKILARTLIFIEPAQNPDGRDRFVHNFRVARGLEPDSNPSAAEHNEPWPGGRTNHYYFDLNRDWFALTQPETQARVKALGEWLPLVFVDLHEMGGNSTYFFSPEAVPFNPHLTEDQTANLEIFGRNDAKWFDRFGFDYFTREVYDAFYPGYGASWPSYYGAMAMTYEQASARGLVYRRSDGTDLTFRDGVHHHFVASLSTAEAAADNAEKLWQDFDRYRRSAVEEGRKGDVRAYVIPNRGDTSAARKLAGLLVSQGIEVMRSSEEFRVCGEDMPAGSYIVSLAQPAKRLIRNLLDTDVAMEEEFLKEQERRRSKKMRDEIYDVTSWSLPLMFNVECVPCSRAAKGDFELVGPELFDPGALEGGRAEVAYLVPWGTAAAGRLLAAALRRDLVVLSADKEIVQNGSRYPAGTLILKVEDNPPDLEAILTELAASTGARVVATDTGWVEAGVNFGSRHVVHVRKPKVAIAWDVPTSTSNAGATRFVLERQFGYPVTPVRTRQLARSDLDPFDVLILPEPGFGGGYASALGEAGAKRIKDWVSAGGTLIAIGNAVAYLAGAKVGLLDIDQENLVRESPEDEKAGAKKPAKKPGGASETETDNGRVGGKLLQSREDFLTEIRAEKELPDSVQGVLLKAHVDPDHWLGAGVNETLNVMIRGRSIFTPIKLDKGVNVAYFAGPDEVLTSGYIWEENRKQFAYKPFAVVQPRGRGVVIGFTADPNFRAYMDGLNVLFLNAVFRGPAHARPLVGERED